MAIYYIFIATVLMAVSGVPSLLCSRRSRIGQRIAVALNLIACGLGGTGLIEFAIMGFHTISVAWCWSLPWGRFAFGIDTLTLIFLIPILAISTLGSIYGLEYWKQSSHPGNARGLQFYWGLMAASMMLVLLARDGVLFLMVWEIMAMAAFFLITTEDNESDVCQAGWVYLVAAHVGFICLVAMFTLLHVTTGSFHLWPIINRPITTGASVAIFVLSLVGFGLKVGLMPMHFWLPGAHANAPSHVSALFSGVMLNIGIYGLVRIGGLLAVPPVWSGITFLVMGAISGVAAMIFAVCQNDYKRLLAYSSIENMGIVGMGLGLAMLGRSLHQPAWILLGLGGALFHLLNHSLFKSLLFLGAGNLLHATGTRRMDRLGGLGRNMPFTFALVLIGGIAICALPPLNGFAGEWLIYLGLLRTLTHAPEISALWVGLIVPTLAMIGALAVMGFVKFLGMVFCGNPRSPDTKHAHNPGYTSLGPMVLLAMVCILIGLDSGLATGLLERAVRCWDPARITPDQTINSLAPLPWITITACALVFVVVVGLVILWMAGRDKKAAIQVTWSCGYIQPSARMQYTGRSFSRILAEMFAWLLLSRKGWVLIRSLHPRQMDFTQEVADPLLDRGLIPGFAFIQRIASFVRPLQARPVNVYLAYMLATLLVLLIALRF